MKEHGGKNGRQMPDGVSEKLTRRERPMAHEGLALTLFDQKYPDIHEDEKVCDNRCGMMLAFVGSDREKTGKTMATSSNAMKNAYAWLEPASQIEVKLLESSTLINWCLAESAPCAKGVRPYLLAAGAAAWYYTSYPRSAPRCGLNHR